MLKITSTNKRILPIKQPIIVQLLKIETKQNLDQDLLGKQALHKNNLFLVKGAIEHNKKPGIAYGKDDLINIAQDLKLDIKGNKGDLANRIIKYYADLEINDTLIHRENTTVAWNPERKKAESLY
jgi:hypothetical protein